MLTHILSLPEHYTCVSGAFQHEVLKEQRKNKKQKKEIDYMNEME